jgi:hypothetical protein
MHVLLRALVIARLVFGLPPSTQQALLESLVLEKLSQQSNSSASHLTRYQLDKRAALDLDGSSSGAIRHTHLENNQQSYTDFHHVLPRLLQRRRPP